MRVVGWWWGGRNWRGGPFLPIGRGPALVPDICINQYQQKCQCSSTRHFGSLERAVKFLISLFQSTMGRPRFGRRSTPPRIEQVRKDAKFPHLDGKILLTSSEADQAIWSYRNDGSSTDGALRLISVKKLLASTSSSTIELFEWSGLKTWPRDDPTRLAGTLPRQWPRYAAISHVWQPSEDAARLANEANRPLKIEVDKPEPHEISWLGLVQAATAARAHRCQYLWLDLLCLNQQSDKDKKIQIKNMAKIYRNAAMVIVMPGGVIAAQNFDKPSSWINRAWTFQEATLGWPSYVLVNWILPGSFSYFKKLKFPNSTCGIALASLQSLTSHHPGQILGVSTLVAEDGTGTRQYESNLPVLCLGDDPATVSALASIMEIEDINHDGDEDDQKNLLSASAFYDPDAPSSSEWETDDNDDHDYSIASPEQSSRIPNYSGGGESGAGFSFDYGSSSDDDIVDDFHEPKHFKPKQDSHPWDIDNDKSSEEANPQDRNSGGPPILHSDLEIRYSAVWRSMWLRTSTKEQDLVYSMMHLLDTSIDVKYSRSLEGLIFELVDKTRSTPAWLTIGYDIPVRPESGLIPVYPTFESNSNPTYCIEGRTLPASEVVCNGEFFCQKFDIDIKHSSMEDGHLICAIILDVNTVSEYDPKQGDSHLFHDVKLRLSYPSTYTVDTACKFKGHIGSVAVVIGDYSTSGEIDSFGISQTSFIFFLGIETGTWQKTGAGWLSEPLLALNVLPKMKRRHLKVGVGSANEKPVECDCHNASKYQHYRDGNDSIEDIEDLATALAQAASNGDESRTRQLVGLGADVNAQVGSMFGTPLLAACCGGNVRVVEFLLARGANVNNPTQVNSSDLHWKGEWYGTPLQAACIRGFEPVARLLISKGADINAQVGPDGSALHATLRNGYNKQLTQLLLNHGANVNAPGGMYGTPLMAAQTHDPPSTELVNLLLEHGAEINSTVGKFITEDGWLCRGALQMACRHGALELVRILITRGADVNLRSGGSFATALQEAAYYGHSLICEVLLDNDAEVNIQGGHFGNALQATVAGLLYKDYHTSGIREYIIRLLLERGANINAKGGYYGDALTAADVIGKFPIFNLLIENGAIKKKIPLHVDQHYEWTTLHSASNFGRIEVVEALFERGHITSVVDSDGCTPLHLASRNGHVDVAQVLLKINTNVHTVDNNGCTPLHLASDGGYTELVKLLLENGADPTVTDGQGYSATVIAAMNCHDAITKMLLDHIANSENSHVALGNLLLSLAKEGNYSTLQLLINKYHLDYTQVDAQGRNAAHFAAQAGSLISWTILIKRINPFALDVQQNGVLHYAARSSSVDMVRKTLPFYTTPTGYNNWSPLHWACRSGNAAMVNLLLESGHCESIVTTTEPPGQWTPYAIAVFHQNKNLMSNLKGTASSRLGFIPSAVQSSAPKHGDYECNGCELVRIIDLSLVSCSNKLGNIRTMLSLYYLC
jgi:ankyrin repeat protein